MRALAVSSTYEPMPAPLSLDLRRRIVEAARDASNPEVARRFGVGLTTVERFVRADREGRSLQPKSPPGADRLVKPDGEALFAAWLAENPSLTQADLAARYEAETGIAISRQTAGRTIARMGQTRKKRP